MRKSRMQTDRTGIGSRIRTTEPKEEALALLAAEAIALARVATAIHLHESPRERPPGVDGFTWPERSR